MAEASFPAEVVSAAQASERFWLDNAKVDIPASVTLAQWAIESDWGKSLSGKNNPFGIKATPAQISSWRATRCATKEFENGRYVSKSLYFADFDSVADAFEEHGRLLATSGYYVKARHADSAEQFARDLTGIYATAPNYGDVLIAIMRQRNLKRYDLTQDGLPASKAPIVEQHKETRAGTVAAGAAAGGVVVAAATHGAWAPPFIAAIAVAAIVLVTFIVYLVRKG